MTGARDEAEMIRMFPVGGCHLLLVIARTKRALLGEMADTDRLLVLEKLNALADDEFLTQQMLAAVQPMSDLEVEMMDAAQSLDREAGDASLDRPSFQILTRPGVFDNFVRLNPSYLAAIKIREAKNGASHNDRSD